LRATEVLAQAAGVRHRGWAARVRRLQVVKLLLEGRVGLRVAVGCFQLVERRYEHRGHVAPAKLAVIAAIVGQGLLLVLVDDCFTHDDLSSPAATGAPRHRSSLLPHAHCAAPEGACLAIHRSGSRSARADPPGGSRMRNAGTGWPRSPGRCPPVASRCPPPRTPRSAR